MCKVAPNPIDVFITGFSVIKRYCSVDEVNDCSHFALKKHWLPGAEAAIILPSLFIATWCPNAGRVGILFPRFLMYYL
jgi:hypothetical protein